jgi:hypothetical protein
LSPELAPPISSVSSRWTTPTSAWPGRQRADDLLAERFFPDAGGEVLDHRQRDVGFEQGHAYFAQHVGNVVFGQSGLAAQVFYDATEALGKVV